MDTMRYYVWVELHNGETGGYAYPAKPDTFDDIDEAEKKYHEYLNTYIKYGSLDRVSVMVIDSFCNVLMSRVWAKAYEPEPQPEDDRLLSEA